MPIAIDDRLQRVQEELGRAMRAAAHLLNRDGDLATHTATVSSTADEVLAASLDIVAETASGVRWADRVLAIRALDRVLALLSCLNGELEAITGSVPFGALLHDGTRRLAQCLNDMRGRASSRYQVWGSGPIVQLASSAIGHANSAYRFGLSDPGSRRFLLGGVAADGLDLLEELSVRLASARRLGLSSTDRIAIRDAWVRASGSMSFDIRDRALWECGELYSAEAFAANLGRPVKEVRAAARSRTLLAVTLWDGSLAYPAVQVDSSRGALWPELEALLQMVDWRKVTTWSIAFWLGQKDGTGKPYATYLRDRAGLGRLQAQLQSAELLVPSAVMGAPLPVFPDAAAVAAAHASGEHSTITGIGGAISTAWAAGKRKTTKQSRLYRVTRREYGAFHFSSAAGRRGQGGRFDLPITGRGTCYLATDVHGALSEVFSRVLVLDVQEVTTRTLWLLQPLQDVTPLLDLGATSRLSKKWSLSLALSYDRARPETQELAAHADVAGYVGIKHTLRNAATGTGVALFGGSGSSAPEVCGLGSWSSVPTPLADSPDFWKWLSNERSSGRLTALANQLPLRKII